MSTQRYISTSFWNDKWIRTIDPSERYLYMYLLTNPQTNIAGIYQITLDRIAFDTGYDERTLLMVFDRFEAAGKAVFFHDEWIILPSWPKHQKWEKKRTIRAGIESALKEIPEIVLSKAKSIGYTYPIGSLPIKHGYGPSYPDSDSDSDSDSNSDSNLDADPRPAGQVEVEKKLFRLSGKTLTTRDQQQLDQILKVCPVDVVLRELTTVCTRASPVKAPVAYVYQYLKDGPPEPKRVGARDIGVYQSDPADAEIKASERPVEELL